MIYKVVFEIEVIAETPLEAAKNIQESIQDPDVNWTYSVQPNESDIVFDVDLAENDESAVSEVKNYVPLIK